MSSITESVATSRLATPPTGTPVRMRARSAERSPSAGSSPPTLLECRKLQKSYRKGSITIPVLRGVDFSAAEGHFTAVVGQSGSGKSTLLHVMATLDSPDAGHIYFEGNRIDHLPSTGRDVLRNQHFGMIFQFYHLLPELSTLENVLLPGMIARGIWSYLRSQRRQRERACHLLDLVGLGHRLRHKPRELSGGEMQRVAIARSLMAEPQILMADEPTGNLDRKTGQEILQLLRSLNDRENLTIVMVTHDQAVARQADRVVQLVEGQLQETSCP